MQCTLHCTLGPFRKWNTSVHSFCTSCPPGTIYKFLSIFFTFQPGGHNYHTGLNYRTKWQFFKIKVKEASIRFGINRAKKKKEYINNIQKNLDDLNKKSDQGEHIDVKEKENLEKKLNGYYQEKENGCKIRSKVNWKNEGERSSAYFFNLEKK